MAGPGPAVGAWVPSVVRFDRRAAADAVREYRRAATELDQTAATIAAGMAALALWRGAARNEIEARLAAIAREAESLSRDLRSSALRVDLAERAAMVRVAEAAAAADVGGGVAVDQAPMAW